MGYFHKDVKCDNIFLSDNDESACLGDFANLSISEVLSNDVPVTRKTSLIGTPGYTSPSTSSTRNMEQSKKCTLSEW